MSGLLAALQARSRELLVEMESGLLQCERSAGNTETINSIFRVAPSLPSATNTRLKYQSLVSIDTAPYV